MKYGLILFILLAVFLIAGCAAHTQDPAPVSAGQQTETVTPTVTVDFDGFDDETSQTHTLTGADAETLAALLQSLNYDPMKVCKCLPSTTVTLNSGAQYGIDLGDTPHVRLYETPQAQADLTPEQAETIRNLLDPLKNH